MTAAMICLAAVVTECVDVTQFTYIITINTKLFFIQLTPFSGGEA